MLVTQLRDAERLASLGLVKKTAVLLTQTHLGGSLLSAVVSRSIVAVSPVESTGVFTIPEEAHAWCGTADLPEPLDPMQPMAQQLDEVPKIVPPSDTMAPWYRRVLQLSGAMLSADGIAESSTPAQEGDSTTIPSQREPPAFIDRSPRFSLKRARENAAKQCDEYEYSTSWTSGLLLMGSG
jgi:hypothetical protein